MNHETGADMPTIKPSDRGPEHYKQLALEPWEIIERNELDFFEGNALKYLLRHKRKNGKDDLLKAIHYLEKLIELRYDND